jgi:hypothetical protein
MISILMENDSQEAFTLHVNTFFPLRQSWKSNELKTIVALPTVVTVSFVTDRRRYTVVGGGWVHQDERQEIDPVSGLWRVVNCKKNLSLSFESNTVETKSISERGACDKLSSYVHSNRLYNSPH